VKEYKFTQEPEIKDEMAKLELDNRVMESGDVSRYGSETDEVLQLCGPEQAAGLREKVQNMNCVCRKCRENGCAGRNLKKDFKEVD